MKILASLVLTALLAVNPRLKVPSPMEEMAREVVVNFTGGRFDAARMDFNEELKPQITSQMLAQIKTQMDAQVGSFRSITSTTPFDEGGLPGIEMIAKFEKASVLFRIGFDRNNKVRSVIFNPIVPTTVDPVLEKNARAFLTNLMAGRYDEPARSFDDTMRLQLSPANFAALRENLLKVYGNVQSVTEVRERNQPPYRIIDVFATCERLPLAFRVAFDGRDRIAAVHLSPNVNP